jgi:hypothetical protein
LKRREEAKLMAKLAAEDSDNSDSSVERRRRRRRRKKSKKSKHKHRWVAYVYLSYSLATLCCLIMKIQPTK